MRYSVFEEASAEASVGMSEVEAQLHRILAEIEHLNVKKDLLKAVSRQLLMLLPASTHSTSPNAPECPGLSVEAPAPEPPSSGEVRPQADQSCRGDMVHSSSFSLREEIREAWRSKP